jgi:hypothetical protein
LQGALFPDGLTYDPDNGFGTALTRWPVTAIKELAATENRMAPPRGIEPLFAG